MKIVLTHLRVNNHWLFGYYTGRSGSTHDEVFSGHQQLLNVTFFVRARLTEVPVVQRGSQRFLLNVCVLANGVVTGLKFLASYGVRFAICQLFFENFDALL
jgi:hypothetical protein